jgi:formiminoglutamate deiminase
MTTYWCERALVEAGNLVDGLVVETAGTRIRATSRASTAPTGSVRLPGLTVPGFANCHSHAFHRALRGRTQQAAGGSFWSWRDSMYDVAARLDPDSYYRLALAVYEEMALAGITAVGEFHYLHHGEGGVPYADPNAMGHAVVAAARDAGIRIALLDTCYLSSGFGAAPQGAQLRFSDGSVDQWAARVSGLDVAAADVGVVVGSAIHSVRAVARDDLPAVAAVRPSAPLHVHLSEQVAENDACLQRYGRTPTQVLSDVGVLGSRVTAVHATHLTDSDITGLGRSGCFAALCPTTERDLADGVGPARQLADNGATLTLGTDSHAVIDMFEEMRAVELDTRLVTSRRGHWSADELLRAATASGQLSLGFPDAGRMAPGQWADLVTIDLDSPRTAGTGRGCDAAVFAASAADITSVVASGTALVLEPAEVGHRLGLAVNDLLERP